MPKASKHDAKAVSKHIHTNIPRQTFEIHKNNDDVKGIDFEGFDLSSCERVKYQKYWKSRPNAPSNWVSEENKVDGFTVKTLFGANQ